MFHSPDPYTGVPLAQDPAVMMIEIQNEEEFFFRTFDHDDSAEARPRLGVFARLAQPRKP